MMINVTAVSYLNTKPFLYGLVQSKLFNQIRLSLDVPSVCATKLLRGEADLGLVPVAAIPHLPNAQLVSDFCIGAEGAVRTVAIFADLPLEQITHLYLDYHSRTSVELVKLLLKHYWKLNIIFLPTHAGFETQVRGTTAALIIGDRAIEAEERHPFVYDLAVAWTNYTGLPFVFAAWVSNKPLGDTFLKDFNDALRFGLDNVSKLLFLLQPPREGFNLLDYYSNNISYTFDEAKKQALDLFLKSINGDVLGLKKLQKKDLYLQNE